MDGAEPTDNIRHAIAAKWLAAFRSVMRNKAPGNGVARVDTSNASIRGLMVAQDMQEVYVHMKQLREDSLTDQTVVGTFMHFETALVNAMCAVECDW